MQWASCGLNKAIWDPWFLVPIMNSLLKRLETKICIGDQLLPVPQFFLHHSLWPYVGVDFSQFSLVTSVTPYLNFQFNSLWEGESMVVL